MKFTFVNIKERADAVAGSVKVVQSSAVKVLASYNINSGVINRVRENQCSHVNGSHQDSSVNFLLALRGSSKMERSGHIRRSVYKTQDVKISKWIHHLSRSSQMWTTHRDIGLQSR